MPDASLASSVAETISRDVILPLLTAGLTALGGWLVTKLPGPLRDWLQSATHQRDIALIVNSMARKAAAAQAAPGPPATPDQVIAYTASVLPGVVAKVGLPPEALETMAEAAIATAVPLVTPAAVTPA